MFLNKDTGELLFSDGLRLYDGMTAEELHADGSDAVFCAGARNADGVALSVECHMKRGVLYAVTLRPIVGNASRRRTALFDALRIADPCPDTRACVRVAAPFGELCIASEPYFGLAEARLEYTAHEGSRT